MNIFKRNIVISDPDRDCPDRVLQKTTKRMQERTNANVSGTVEAAQNNGDGDKISARTNIDDMLKGENGHRSRRIRALQSQQY